MVEIVDKENEGANLSFVVKILLPLPLGATQFRATGLKTRDVFLLNCVQIHLHISQVSHWFTEQYPEGKFCSS